MMRALCVLALLASSTSLAQTFPFAASLETAAGPFDGLVDVDVAIVNGSGDVLWNEAQTGVVVVGGEFAIDVGAVVPLPVSLPGASQLALTVDDDALPPIPLARLIRADGAKTATVATAAATTNALAGAGPGDVATRQALAVAGGPAVDFSNIAGVAASVRDGDQGTDVSGTSADLSVSARTLNIATVTGARLAAGSVSGTRLVAGATQVADGAITGAKVADRALTRSALVEDVTAREVKTVPVFVQSNGACGTGFTTSSVCVPPSCGAGKQTGCDGTGCSSPAPLAIRQCVNTTKVGELVVEQ